MVRPLGHDHNSLKVKTLKGNAIGLNMTGLQKIVTPKSKSQAKEFSPFRQRFNYALQPELRKDIFNIDSEDVFTSCNKEKTTTDALTYSWLESKAEGLSLLCKTGPTVNHKKNICGTSIHKESQGKTKRKHRMRDEFGNLCRIRAKNPQTTKTASPKRPARDAAERLNRLVLNIRCFKIGTLSTIVGSSDTPTTQCTFTVDYIDIANEVRIEASEVTSCEWCTVQRLPSLFLQTAPAEGHHLRLYDVYEDCSRALYDCQSKKEKYIALIFEKELTFPEQLILEEIFKEIGRSNNICNFPVKLSYEEAYSRLKTHKRAPKQQITALEPEEDELPVTSVTILSSPDATRCEIATLSVSDSDADLLELPSTSVQEIKKLVVYPPPPAKGGITITEQDLGCLEEGTFLNDVIVDFYLRFLVCEQLKREDAVDCHVFSSFFFKHLTQEDHRRCPETAGLSIQELRHNRVKTWTRHVNIFEKDFVFVPINQRAHWYLAVICFPGRVSQTSDVDVCVTGHSVEYICDLSPPNPMSLFYRQESSEHNTTWSQTIGDLNKSFCIDDDDSAVIQAFGHTCVNSESNDSKRYVSVGRPCILIMDSLHCRSRSSVVQILQEYLQEEWMVKKGFWQSFGKEVMDGWSPRVPKQDNFTDCGIYLLQYVENFLKDPPQTFRPSMDLNDWFSQKTVKKKRQQIKRLILKLHRQQTV